jgi:YbaB/EbfC DNA-binding family
MLIMSDSNGQLRVQLDSLLREYDQARRSLTDVRAKMRAVTGAARSPDRLVEATVGPRGTLTALRLDTKACRTLSAEKLAEQILDTVRRAAADANGQLSALLAPVLPTGAPVNDMISGDVDPASWPHTDGVTGTSLREWWEGVAASQAGTPS